MAVTCLTMFLPFRDRPQTSGQAEEVEARHHPSPDGVRQSLQKFSAVHAQVHNHFNQERHLVTRQVYKQRGSAALAEWRALAA